MALNTGTSSSSEVTLTAYKHTSGLVVDYSSKVGDSKLGFVRVLWGNVVGVQLMLGVQFVEHGRVSTL